MLKNFESQPQPHRANSLCALAQNYGQGTNVLPVHHRPIRLLCRV